MLGQVWNDSSIFALSEHGDHGDVTPAAASLIRNHGCRDSKDGVNGLCVLIIVVVSIVKKQADFLQHQVQV